MGKESIGYIGKDNEKWFARVTFTDSKGRRKNIKRIAETESEARSVLKKLIKKLENEGEKFFDAEKLTFNQLVEYYEKHFLHKAEYANGRLISGLRDVSRVKKERSTSF